MLYSLPFGFPPGPLVSTNAVQAVKLLSHPYLNPLPPLFILPPPSLLKPIFFFYLLFYFHIYTQYLPIPSHPLLLKPFFFSSFPLYSIHLNFHPFFLPLPYLPYHPLTHSLAS